MSESPQHTAIEYTCPRCQKAMGRPFHFSNDGRLQLRVLIRCQYCQHRWSVLIARDATK
jgi:DNA-directed RNA polymerase subunit RPC12/RpoP